MGCPAHFLFVLRIQPTTTVNILPDHVRIALLDACTAAGAELIDVTVRGTERQPLLDVTIDTLEGVSHEHCRDVSRGLDERLADDEWYGRLRAVDVSSPGADAPVKYLWQLKKHVGRTVRCTRTDGTVVEGTLVSATDDTLVLLPRRSGKPLDAPSQTTITSGDVASANVVISFS